MLALLGDAARGYDAWRLVALTPLPAWGVAAAVLVLLLALVAAQRGLRLATRRQRAILLGLRILAAVGVALLLLEPGVELMATLRERGRFAVVIDASASMRLRDGTTSRYDQLRAWLRRAEPALKRLGQELDLEVLRFAAQPEHAASVEQALALPAEGEGTDLLQALGSLAPRPGSRKLAGVLLLSDGADTAALRVPSSPALAPPRDPPPASTAIAPRSEDGKPAPPAPAPVETHRADLASIARPALAALGAPVLVVPIGEPAQFKDLAVTELRVDDFAFVRNPIDIEVRVSAHGLTSTRVPVTLREGTQVVAVTDLILDPSASEQRALLRLTPAQTGKRSFVVELPVLEGEAVVENNRAAFTLKVIRDRIRVLQVAGRPSWDVRYLRELLKANPSVDLISFFILRTPSDVAGQNDELSLIPFPTDELFTKELKTFDIVVLQNFNYRPYRMGHYLDNIRRFVVEQGGGLIMTGGDLSFSEAGYQGTPLVDVLPVVLPPMPQQYRRAPYRPVATEAGQRHPVLELERERIAMLLERLPAFEGFNMSAGLASGAQALLVHPYERVAGQGAPVLASREVGRGRTLALLTDDSWYWSLPDVRQGGRGTAHRRLWANALRWLTRDPALARVRVEVTPQRLQPDRSVDVRVRTLDEAYQGLPGAAVQLELLREDQPSAGPSLRQDLRSDAAGEAFWRVDSAAPGAYRVRARASATDGSSLGDDEDVFVVQAASVERTDARPRPALLRELARLSGGRVLDAPADLDRVELPDATTVRVQRAQRLPLWDSLWVALILVSLVASEWWLRRRWGFA